MTDLGPWKRIPRDKLANAIAAGSGAPGLRLYQRDVEDGHLMVLAGAETGPDRDAPRWHLSISHRTNSHPPEPGRYPTWDEITEARYRFMPGHITVVQILPPRDQYVNVASTTFHLWEIPEGALNQ